ncbi:MAG: type II toxin-antitoxin system RelE/ParE family toxin [Gammaproteobacteria bacterium]|nr:MAG: type II toxin-antitoxin system RelE/ParE family toxin [Gammaproteobacteria bacterium]
MSSFKLTNKAKIDLVKIAKYTEAQWGREQRNLYLKQFDNIFHLILDKPLIGKECDYIKTHYRKFPQGSNIIFYKEADKSNIEIIRILHKNMDVSSKFS